MISVCVCAFQATKPVQEHLGMLIDQKRHQYRTALYLPSPLYVLYVQAAAYAEACGEWHAAHSC